MRICDFNIYIFRKIAFNKLLKINSIKYMDMEVEAA
jgi:hypothetical protein